MSEARSKKISACPSWLGLSDDRRAFVYIEERASIVRKIFELSIGGFGSYFIAKHLNGQKVPAFPPSEKWDHTTIDSMLRNRATVGEHQPKNYANNNKKGIPTGSPISNYYPAVISEEMFQAAQAARQNNLAVRRGRKGEGIANLFEGLTSCAYCGNEVSFNSHGNRKSLVCDSVQKNVGCIRAGWSYKNFEHSVFLFLSHPALKETIRPENGATLDYLVELITDDGSNRADARVEIVATLRKSVTSLSLACAGPSPLPTLPSALVRRDLPKRFFLIRLWGGELYRGRPIPLPGADD